MKTPKFFLTAMLLLTSLCPIQAQLTEHFSDGDFSDQPSWVTGNAGDWQINNSFQLQSNSTVANSSFWISTENKLATSAQWDVWMRLQFNPSGANYVDVYLTASASDLVLNTTTGYVVRIGNTDDEIALYRKQSNGTMIKIIDGTNGILNTSQNTIRIRVTRNAAHEWTLMRAMGGNDQEMMVEGKIIDSTYRQSVAFGLLVRQSTASFFQRHFFDDFSIKPYEDDLIPPGIVSATAISPTHLEILFNEPVSAVSASQTGYYIVNNGVGNPAAAQRSNTNPSLVTLTFHQPFRNGFIHELMVDGVEDLFGNKLKNEKTTFSFYTPKRNDAIITEIMSDPSPEVGLPNATWIELLNTSNHSFNLQGWRIGREDASISGPMPAFVLQPDSMVILCSAGNAAQMQQFGNTLSVPAFPSLPVSGAVIWIQQANGKTMHSAKYQPDWHNNPIKANGGWSLEIIDPNHPCGGRDNWRSSVDRKGGTPGKKNSVHGSNTDMTAPKILYAFAIDSTHISITFNEPVDSMDAATASNYFIEQGAPNVESAWCIAPLFQETILQLNAPLDTGKVYSIRTENIKDCKDNIIQQQGGIRVALAQQPAQGDIVINEILFDPIGSGADFVELYNRSKKSFNLKQLLLANRSNGNIANFKNLTEHNQLFFPGSLLTFTDDTKNIRQAYTVEQPEWLIEMSTLPSFPNNAGNVVLSDIQGSIIDEVAYSDAWHFKLIENKEGVSLERINPNAPAQRSDNWTSAAKTVGYGSPTAQNSQYRQDAQVQGSISVHPQIFSPDQDGFDDFAFIDYRFPEPGYVLNITIFDANGSSVRALQRNAICGTSGTFRWDGLNEQSVQLPMGPYVIYSEAFNLAGQVKRNKHQIVLARRW